MQNHKQKPCEIVNSKDFHDSVGVYLERAAYANPLRLKRYSRDYLVILRADEYDRLVAAERVASAAGLSRSALR